MSEPLAEHDLVVFTQDVPTEGLRAGDVGVIMMTHPGHDDMLSGYSVEVATLLGETVAIADVAASLVRPAAEHEVRHARPVSIGSRGSVRHDLPARPG
jgi:hypothetical protein